MLSELADMARWIAAVFAGILPRRMWPALQLHLPMRSAAAMSGIVTLLAGFFYAFGGFMIFATNLAAANNDWMLTRLAGAPAAGDAAAGLVPYGVSVVTLFIYVFLTPRGLFSTYVFVSGTLRAISGYLDDPHGDPILSVIVWSAETLFHKNRNERRQIARRRLEGADAADVLQTGAWAGLPDDDFVVLSARKKPGWDAGAIVMTSSDWFRLGLPFDMLTPAGLRTAYPLKKMDTVEVVRRGIHYELPRLRGTQRPQSAQS
jgi:hypothetical protein